MNRQENRELDADPRSPVAPRATQGPRPWSRVLEALVVVFLVWRGGVSVFALADELRSTDTQRLRRAWGDTELDRIRATLRSGDRMQGVREGLREELYLALVDETQEDELVYAVGPEEDARRTILAELRFLAYPRDLRWTPVRATQAQRLTRTGGFSVLEFDDAARGELLQAGFESVASGPGWKLWH